MLDDELEVQGYALGREAEQRWRWGPEPVLREQRCHLCNFTAKGSGL